MDEEIDEITESSGQFQLTLIVSILFIAFSYFIWNDDSAIGCCAIPSLIFGLLVFSVAFAPVQEAQSLDQKEEDDAELQQGELRKWLDNRDGNSPRDDSSEDTPENLEESMVEFLNWLDDDGSEKLGFEEELGVFKIKLDELIENKMFDEAIELTKNRSSDWHGNYSNINVELGSVWVQGHRKFQAIEHEIKQLRAPKSSRHISQDVKDKVWRRDEGKCRDCGSNQNLEFDHIIPYSKGGANTYRNIQLLCQSCNRKKSDKIG
jgi:hypothetical protein